MELLDPWWSTAAQDEVFHRTFTDQLARETSPGHLLHKVPVRLIARGNGDDALFEIMDGSGRVAQVHLVWQGRQKPPWPSAAIYESLDDWRIKSMLPEHQEWIDD